MARYVLITEVWSIIISHLEEELLSSMLLKEISNKLLTYRNKDLVLLTKYLSNISCLSEVEKNNCFVLANKNTSITKMFNEKTFKRKMCFSRRNAKKKLVNVEIRTWYKIWTSKNKQILTEKKRKKKKKHGSQKKFVLLKVEMGVYELRKP